MCSGQIMQQHASDGVLTMVCKLCVVKVNLKVFTVFNTLACHFI